MFNTKKNLKAGMKELKGMVYRARFLASHSHSGENNPVFPSNRFLAELELGVEHIKANVGSVAKYLQYMWDSIDDISYPDPEVQKLLQGVINNSNLKTALSTNFRLDTRTIHTELTKEELVKAVLHFFKNNNYNTDPAFMYVAPLQSDLREMITLFDLTEQDYEQLMEELINPVMIEGDWHTSTVTILFELLRKKKMKSQWEHRQSMMVAAQTVHQRN